MAMETCECRSSNGRSLGPEVQITSSTVQPSPWARTCPVRRPRAPLRASRARACSRATAIFAKTSPRRRRMMLARSEPTEKVTHTEVIMSATTTAKTAIPDGLDATVLARVMEEGYGPGAWHGPDLKAALADVPPELAFWRTAPGRHSIAEIALHHAYCTRSVRGQLSGTPPEPFVLEGEDWFALSDRAGLTWPEILAVVDAEQGRLATLV